MNGDSNMQQRQDQYVLARGVLLDALETLHAHLDAITLVGAQAIYLWVGENNDLNVAPYTTDADLALDPNRLGPEPELVQTLKSAGFEQSSQKPGIWESGSSGITVDFLVPETLGGPGRRAARLPGHGKHAARKVQGLDSALVDREKKSIAALDSSDKRSLSVYVAGPGALLVAKLYKLWDRRTEAQREDAKDALDLFRILRAFPSVELAERITSLRNTPFSQAEAQQALVYLNELFLDETAHGAQLVGDAVGVLANRDEITLSSVVLAHDLLAAIGE